VAAQIVVLSGLRRMSVRVQSEMKNMGVAIDVENNPLLAKWHREAKDKGRAKGRAEGMAALVNRQLSEKFERLPKWAQQRVLTADSLEGVIGKR
jgi:flagellar biosynthesis/type III secretory pathway protein FliH